MNTKRDLTNLQSLFTFGVSLILGTLAMPGVASAACPAAYSTAACDAGTGLEICEMIGNIWRCKLDTGSSGGAMGYVVWDGTNTEYSAYGQADNGTDFCCVLSNLSGLEEVHLVGSDAADSLLSFVDVTAGLQLEAYTAAAFKGLILGQDGDDVIYGSDASDAYYTEYLQGEDGFDSIYGNAGSDYIYGGLKGDYIEGGPGNDIIFGENGHDTILGGDGDDTIEGNDGMDAINGEGWSDDILGGNGQDTLCGGGYTGFPDSFDGGDGPDFICGQPGGAETGTGGPRSDVCYDGATIQVTSCSLNGVEADCIASCP